MAVILSREERAGKAYDLPGMLLRPCDKPTSREPLAGPFVLPSTPPQAALPYRMTKIFDRSSYGLGGEFVACTGWDPTYTVALWVGAASPLR
jgi:hypothetical protein